MSPNCVYTHFSKKIEFLRANKEPLQLEYEGADTHTYTITIQFDTKVDWHVAIASGVVPYYFVVNQ